MITAEQKSKAEYFQALHQSDNILLLPNAWDAVSARLFEKAGAKAIGTTSAGIANCLGFPDGQHIPKYLFLMMVERIIRSVDIPVSVDIEGGFGASIEEVCNTVKQVMELGAVGINLEDFDFNNESHTLVDPELQVAKIRAIRQLAEYQKFPLFINARTDVYWHKNIYSYSKREAETIRRVTSYQKAGASGVFVPGLTSLSAIRNICASVSTLPLNILGGPRLSSLDELSCLGVKRVSLGSWPFRLTTTFLSQAASEIISQANLQGFVSGLSYEEMNGLFDFDYKDR